MITAFISLFIYPLFGHWSWNGLDEGQKQGWLSQLGFIDFAGSTVVHSVGGWVALVHCQVNFDGFVSILRFVWPSKAQNGNRQNQIDKVLGTITVFDFIAFPD